MQTILNVPFSEKSLHDTTIYLSQHIDKNSSPIHVVTANPEIVMQANRNKKYLDILHQADIITPDGIGIVMASKLLRLSLKERVAGFDLIENLFYYRCEQKKKITLFALGTKQEYIELACKNIEEKYPYVEVVGFRNGYFKKEEEESIVEEIQKKRPDLLLVGLGAPKQEEFIYQYKNKLHAKVLIGCGGSLDVFSGKVKRAPKVFQKFHLEWFYRLVTNPSRIKRQFDLVRFLMEVRKERKRMLKGKLGEG